MPLNQAGAVVCINNHGNNNLMLKNSGFNALTALEKESDGSVTFNGSSGIPIVVYYCPVCGYVESYVAQMTPFWK